MAIWLIFSFSGVADVDGVGAIGWMRSAMFRLAFVTSVGIRREVKVGPRFCAAAVKVFLG